MDWQSIFVEIGLGTVNEKVLKALPNDFRRRVASHISSRNPFEKTSANHDLVRATRIAWIDATSQLVNAARKTARVNSGKNSAENIETVCKHAVKAMDQIRDLAFNRARKPGECPIDKHVDLLIFQIGETLAPGGDMSVVKPVTADFPQILVELTNWETSELPDIFTTLADKGLPVKNGENRSFGELMFAAFAELIKNPNGYVQAREALHILTQHKTRQEIGEGFLVMQEVLADTDAYLKTMLGQIAEDTKAIRDDTGDILTELVETRRSNEEINAKLEKNQASLDLLVAELATRDQDRVDRLLRANKRGELSRTGNNYVDAALAEIAELTKRDKFKEGSRLAADAFQHWQANEDERQANARKVGLRVLDVGIEQNLFDRDFAAVARRVSQKVELKETDASKRFEALRAAQDEWYVRGRDKGLNLDLEVAIEIAQLALDQAKGADERGSAGNDLGLAFSSLGERESGSEGLEAAVDAYRAALEERTQDRVPLDWAMTQNNLGTALSSLGQRESGSEGLEAAVDAYRAALEERTQDRVPLDWAMTQNNLGNTLLSLGQRESGIDGLEAAVAAYRAALEEWTRDRMPLDWASVQINLGNALLSLGQHESGIDGLEAAVAAYRAALEEQTRDRMPLQWANSIGRLGVAKMVIAERQSDCAMAQDAVQKMRLAFDVLRDGGHSNWAAIFEQFLPRATALVTKLCG